MVQLTKAEKDFMKIFKSNNIVCDECLGIEQIMFLRLKYLSPTDQNKVHEIWGSLVEKGYLYKKDGKDGLFLTEKGEKYIIEHMGGY